MTHARFTPLSNTLPASVPFVGPETQERQFGTPFSARLGANESTFGPAPSAIDAMRTAAHWKYPDPENHDLRHALAAHTGARPDNIVVGEGIDGLLGYLVRLTVGPGDAVVTSDGAYPTFNYHVAGFGGTLHKIPFDTQDREDVDALFAKAAQVDAKLVYLANPDNPMGSVWQGTDIVRAMDKLPKQTLLVLDEAYLESAPPGTSPELAMDDPRLIRLRTFSKLYGLAGARVGYALGHPDLISAFNKVRNHFGVSRAGQAGALAALADQSWLQHVQSQVITSRARINDIAHENGLMALPSATNFVTIDCGRTDVFAKAVLSGLLNAGIFVRMPFVSPQNRCIRVSCSTPADLDTLARALPKVLATCK
ncbi:MAG: pyridoxal phosphate-dependent aminotransferase [Paracoccaceae bacterium]